MPQIYLFVPKIPEGMITGYPGFPSIFVPYGKYSDFFFSGHCGNLTIHMCEWYKLNNIKMFIISVFGLLFTIFACIALRFHYIADVTTGIMVANWVYMIVEKYESKINCRGMKI